jgi:inorganic triphosphatase YgiF
METELKLRLARRHNAAFKRRMATLARPDSPAAGDLLCDRYFDTPTLDLAQRDCGLRLRRQGRRWLQTLKLGQRAGGGLHAREEFEVEVAGPGLEAERIAHAASRDWALAQGEALAVIFETRIRRHRWCVDFADARIEISLDSGSLHAASARCEINEVELELLEGPVDALFALALELARELPLRPETGNKAAAGYALYRQQPPAPSAARIPALTPRMTPFEAVAATVREAMRHVLDNLSALETADDVTECVHQARIALRRLRLADAELDRIAPPQDGGATAHDLGQYARRLGAVRDLDVFIETTLPVLAGPDLAALRPALLRLRERRLRLARAELAAPAFGCLLLELLRRLQRTARDAPPNRSQLADFVGGQFERRARRVRRLARDWPQLSTDARHELRKRIKALRYLSEFFSALYPPTALRRYLAPLQSVQQELGDENDAAVGERLLHELGRQQPQLAGRAAAAREALRQRAAARRHNLGKTMRVLARRDGFWKTEVRRGGGKKK